MTRTLFSDEDLQVQGKTSKSGKKVEKDKVESESENYTDSSSFTSSSDSESDVEEDENGELLTPDVDVKILNTLASIKARDPKIYESNIKFFDEPVVGAADSKQTTKEKKMSLKEYQTRRILSNASDNSEEEEEEYPVQKKSKYATEQESIKDELKRAFYEQEEEEDGLLVKKVKSKKELEAEETDYREFLLQNLKSNPNAHQAMQEWIDYSGGAVNSGTGSKQLSPDEQFLIDYVMSKGWVDKTASKSEPVEEIVKAVEESEEEVERAESFEESYNFRYEHSHGPVIDSHPRVIDDSMRRKEESKRQRERLSKKERRAEAKRREEEEVRRLKNLKREELRKKAEKLVKVSGTRAAADLLTRDGDASEESDFDPDAFDRKMASIFNDDYYEEGDDGEMFIDDDCDADATLNAKTVKKIAKEEKKTVIKEDKKNVVKEHKIEEKINTLIEEELYKLDYEDRIDNLKCRFKYKPVVPSSFGLQVDDILTASDKQLNRHVSIKKLAPYRPTEQQERDIQRYSDKRRVWMFRNAGESLGDGGSGIRGKEAEKEKQRKRK